MGNTKAVQRSAEGDQRGTDTFSGTSASPKSFNIESGERNTSCRLSFSRLEISLLNAVVIFAILSTIFIAMYFTIEKDDNNHCGSWPVNTNNSMIKSINTTMNKTNKIQKEIAQVSLSFVQLHTFKIGFAIPFAFIIECL